MTWTVAACHPPLPEGDVHVWAVDLADSGAEVVASLSALLSDEERWRAERLATRTLHDRSVLRRGQLRCLLGCYLDQNPADLCILNDAFGKPRLSGTAAAGDCRFSLSSSGATCLIAVARGREVGIDVERLRDVAHLAELVRTTFSPAEQRQFGTLPPELRRPAFVRGWTQKEAYLKARGCGLAFGAENVEVAIDPQQPPQLVAVKGCSEEAARWNMVDVSPDGKFPATLVAENRDWICRRFRYRASDSREARPGGQDDDVACR